MRPGLSTSGPLMQPPHRSASAPPQANQREDRIRPPAGRTSFSPSVRRSRVSRGGEPSIGSGATYATPPTPCQAGLRRAPRPASSRQEEGVQRERQAGQVASSLQGNYDW